VIEDGTMRRLTLFSILTLVLTGLSARCGVTVKDQRQPNFAFHFEYGSCLVETFDSSSGSFIHDMGPSEPAITIPLALGEGEMEAIFQKMVKIDFFGYPESFVTTSTGGDPVGMVTPAMHYSLRVQNGDRSHSVSWTDEITGPVTQETENLRQLFQMIVMILEEQPEVRELPAPPVGCL